MSSQPITPPKDTASSGISYQGIQGLAQSITGNNLDRSVPSSNVLANIQAYHNLAKERKAGTMDEMTQNFFDSEVKWMNKAALLLKQPRFAAQYGQGLEAVLTFAPIVKNMHSDLVFQQMVAAEIVTEDEKKKNGGKFWGAS